MLRHDFYSLGRFCIQFVEKASMAAAKEKEPLKVAKQVRDVAATFNTIWPNNTESELIEGAILVGDAKVTDNVTEMQAHVREVLPDGRPVGD